MEHIDAHIHLYPEKLMSAIFSYFDRINWHFPYRKDIPEALQYLKKNGLQKGFLLLYAHRAGMAHELNRWAAGLCRENAELVPFACFHPEDPEPEALVRTCLEDWNFAGFKLHFNVQRYFPEDPRFFPVYRGVEERGKAMVMHISSFPSKSDYLGADRLQAVLHHFPRLKIQVAHLGLPDNQDFWRLMDKYPGIYLDTAFILGNPLFADSGQLVAATEERFPGRVLYGSDFPLICHDLKEVLDQISSLPWDHSFKRKILYENALNFLNS